MATCPSGHESASDDYCDVCGTLIGTAVLTGFTPAAGAAPGQAPGGGSPAEGGCPRCGVPRVGQFCESCGFDFSAASTGTVGPAGAIPPIPQPAVLPQAAPPQAAPPLQAAPPPQAAAPSPPVPSPRPATGAAWTVVVTADRAYYDSVQDAGGPDAAAIGFPAYCPERRFRLAGSEVRVGRRSESRGIHPEIDLTGPPADPGVSRLHVVLVAAPDGTWSVVDPGSANGTLVNGDEIPAGETIPLRDGDVIHLGAWTALTVTAT
jgi:pSer/pThr/pTyr-binding forkhead associated (FHA) protein